MSLVWFIFLSVILFAKDINAVEHSVPNLRSYRNIKVSILERATATLENNRKPMDLGKILIENFVESNAMKADYTILNGSQSLNAFTNTYVLK